MNQVQKMRGKDLQKMPRGVKSRNAAKTPLQTVMEAARGAS